MFCNVLVSKGLLSVPLIFFVSLSMLEKQNRKQSICIYIKTGKRGVRIVNGRRLRGVITCLRYTIHTLYNLIKERQSLISEIFNRRLCLSLLSASFVYSEKKKQLLWEEEEEEEEEEMSDATPLSACFAFT